MFSSNGNYTSLLTNKQEAWGLCMPTHVYVRVCVHMHAHVVLEMGNLLKCHIIIAFVFGIGAWTADQAFSPESVL